ncbi:hypothetical protein ARMSODRAFT_841528, partial [Armillaria solidipes]
ASIARRVALQGVRSVDALIDMIPGDYVDVLRGPLKGIAATATKLVSARSTLEKWKLHQAAGTIPSHLFRQAPVIQLTSDYGSSDDASAHRKKLTDAHTLYMQSLLANAVAAKADDVLFLAASLEPAVLFESMQDKIAKHTAKLLATRKVPRITFDGMTGAFESVVYEEDALVKQQGQNVLADSIAYAFRVVSIVESHAAVESVKQERKKDLSKVAATEMADATRPGPSIQSMVDRAVAARLKQMDTKGGKKNKV